MGVRLFLALVLNSGPVEVLRFFKNDHISAYTQPTDCIFYSTKNQGADSCVDGDMVIFEKIGELQLDR